MNRLHLHAGSPLIEPMAGGCAGDPHSRWLQQVGLLAAAGGASILDGLFDRFAAFAGALLYPS